MKIIAITLLVVCWTAVSIAADQSATAPPKLTEMLDAKDASGKPIVSPEEHAYYDGLNDNLKVF